MENLSKYYNVAKSSVLKSGEILKKYFYSNFKVDYKSERNPVTTADKKSEDNIKKILDSSFRDIDFLCEESCDLLKVKNNKLTWILDPLDGTVNFLHRLPVFSISLALYNGKEGLLGIVYNPISGEFFSAIKNKGAYLNNKRIAVSKINNIEHSLLVTGFPYDYKERAKRVLKNFKNFIYYAEGIRRFGSAAIDLCYVACGRFEGFWEENLKPWDMAAGVVILKEAGGKISDYKGTNEYLFSDTMIASNSKIHKEMLNIIGHPIKKRMSDYTD
ncbi:MAG: hypothetical protein A2539_08025 [Elusimicrobia bacterium RIFOXYD2_FULL_34_15]|nr:MAG: hypothetical protein A2539_08025 [Elusimicrobia bacterium RIFOXYD2_FULL_34_15]